MKLRKSKLYPSDAPTCKSGSTPRLLGISFKSASKIVCEVGAAFSQNPFNRFSNYPFIICAALSDRLRRTLHPENCRNMKDFGSLSQTTTVGFVHKERARHNLVFGIVGEISLLKDGGSTLPTCKSFLARNFVHVQNPQSSL